MPENPETEVFEPSGLELALLNNPALVDRFKALTGATKKDLLKLPDADHGCSDSLLCF